MQRNSISHDLIFRRPTVVDGSGAAGRVCDVAIDGDRISAIRDLQTHSAAKVINAEGLMLTPGFIDVHTHDDGMALRDPAMTPKVTQGVTTVVTGNCGLSIPPLVTDRLPPAPLELLGDQSVFRFPRIRGLLASRGGYASINQHCPDGRPYHAESHRDGSAGPGRNGARSPMHAEPPRRGP